MDILLAIFVGVAMFTKDFWLGLVEGFFSNLFK